MMELKVLSGLAETMLDLLWRTLCFFFFLCIHGSLGECERTGRNTATCDGSAGAPCPGCCHGAGAALCLALTPLSHAVGVDEEVADVLQDVGLRTVSVGRVVLGRWGVPELQL